MKIINLSLRVFLLSYCLFVKAHTETKKDWSNLKWTIKDLRDIQAYRDDIYTNTYAKENPNSYKLERILADHSVANAKLELAQAALQQAKNRRTSLTEINDLYNDIAASNKAFKKTNEEIYNDIAEKYAADSVLNLKNELTPHSYHSHRGQWTPTSNKNLYAGWRKEAQNATAQLQAYEMSKWASVKKFLNKQAYRMTSTFGKGRDFNDIPGGNFIRKIGRESIEIAHNLNPFSWDLFGKTAKAEAEKKIQSYARFKTLEKELNTELNKQFVDQDYLKTLQKELREFIYQGEQKDLILKAKLHISKIENALKNNPSSIFKFIKTPEHVFAYDLITNGNPDLAVLLNKKVINDPSSFTSSPAIAYKEGLPEETIKGLINAGACFLTQLDTMELKKDEIEYLIDMGASFNFKTLLALTLQNQEYILRKLEQKQPLLFKQFTKLFVEEADYNMQKENATARYMLRKAAEFGFNNPCNGEKMYCDSQVEELHKRIKQKNLLFMQQQKKSDAAS